MTAVPVAASLFGAGGGFVDRTTWAVLAFESEIVCKPVSSVGTLVAPRDEGIGGASRRC